MQRLEKHLLSGFYSVVRKYGFTLATVLFLVPSRVLATTPLTGAQCLALAISHAEQNQVPRSRPTPIQNEEELKLKKEKLARLEKDPDANPKELLYLRKKIDQDAQDLVFTKFREEHGRSPTLTDLVDFEHVGLGAERKTPSVAIQNHRKYTPSEIDERVVLELLGVIPKDTRTVFAANGNGYMEGSLINKDPQHSDQWLVEFHWFEKGQLKSKVLSIQASKFLPREQIPTAREWVAKAWQRNRPNLLDEVIAETETRPAGSNRSKSKTNWLDDAVQDAFTRPNLEKISKLENELEQYKKKNGPSSFVDPEALRLITEIGQIRYSMKPYTTSERALLHAFIEHVQANTQQVRLGAGQRQLAAEIDNVLKLPKATLSDQDAELIKKYEVVKLIPEQNRRRQISESEKKLDDLNGWKKFSVSTPHGSDVRKAFPDENPNWLEAIVRKRPEDATAQEKAIISYILKKYPADSEAYQEALSDPAKKFYLERFQLYRQIILLQF